MPLSEFEINKIDHVLSQYCDQTVPEHIRNKLYLSYKIKNHEVILFENRPRFDNPSEWLEIKVAKIKCNLKSRLWTLYWLDQNSKYHVYDRIKPTLVFEDLLEEIEKDPIGIFWG